MLHARHCDSRVQNVSTSNSSTVYKGHDVYDYFQGKLLTHVYVLPYVCLLIFNNQFGLIILFNI